jgi:hypothetical protein
MSKSKKKETLSPNGSVVIDGIQLDSYKTEIVSCNILEVEVGTTGHMGGDTGHGGRTYFRISDLASTDMRCKVSGYSYEEKDYLYTEIEDASSIEISFGGDCELDTFCEALRIGYDVLKQHASSIEPYSHTPLEQRQDRFALYLNELCDLYRKQGNLKGMEEIRKKYHTSGITQQQFYECDLDHVFGYVNSGFCNKVYAYILDNTKTTPAPKYNEQ